MTEKQKNDILVMRKNGAAIREIASQLDLTLDSVRMFCKRYHVKPNYKPCRECGMPIPNGYKSFCSDKCRVKWWKKHRSEARKREYKFVCEHCHKEFVRLRNDHPKYCSHACYINERYHKEGCDG